MNVSFYVTLVFQVAGWLAPSPVDSFDWALRIRPLNLYDSYLAREVIHRNDVYILQLNRSRAARDYLPLDVANCTNDLAVIILRPDRTPVGSSHKSQITLTTDERPKLASGGFTSDRFTWEALGYNNVEAAGTYNLHATLTTSEGKIRSPSVPLRVIDVVPDMILVSCPVPLEGYQAKWPELKREKAAIEQIVISGRTWLFYRKFVSDHLGGKVSAAIRLAELPGKVVMKVEGAFGDGKPITITYKDSNSPTGTRILIINSVDGTPWTEADEAALQQRLKKVPPPKP